MATTDFQSVDEYIATKPGDVQAILERVRSTIRKALPGAEEVIELQIPAYRMHGGTVLYFAGWKHHYSLYPADATSLRLSRRTSSPTRSTIRERSASRSPSPSPCS